MEQLFAVSGAGPRVRQRCAMELATRSGDAVPQLLAMLAGHEPNARCGACQALAALDKRAAAAVPVLRKTLWDDDCGCA